MKSRALRRYGLWGGLMVLTVESAFTLYDRYLHYRTHQRRIVQVDDSLKALGENPITNSPPDDVVALIQKSLGSEEAMGTLAEKHLAPNAVKMMDEFDKAAVGKRDNWRTILTFLVKRPDWWGHSFGLVTRSPISLTGEGPTLAQWLLGTALMFPGGGGPLDPDTHKQIEQRWREQAATGSIRKNLVARRENILTHTIKTLLGGSMQNLAPIMLGYSAMVTMTPLPEVAIKGGKLQLAVVMTTGFHILDGIAVWGVAERDGKMYWVSWHVGRHKVAFVDALNVPFAAMVFHTAFHRFASVAGRWSDIRARLQGMTGPQLTWEALDIPEEQPVSVAYTLTDRYDLWSDAATLAKVDHDLGWAGCKMRDMEGTGVDSWISVSDEPIPPRIRPKAEDYPLVFWSSE